jgi:hypothetical protein
MAKGEKERAAQSADAVTPDGLEERSLYLNDDRPATEYAWGQQPWERGGCLWFPSRILLHMELTTGSLAIFTSLIHLVSNRLLVFPAGRRHSVKEGFAGSLAQGFAVE